MSDIKNYCKYGCGLPGIRKLKSGDWICCDLHMKCPENRKKYGQPGKSNPMYNRTQNQQVLRF